MLSGSLATTVWSVFGFADGQEGLQIQRVAANILNKQLRTVDNERHSSLGVARGG
jgi:hypothetical protein